MSPESPTEAEILDTALSLLRGWLPPSWNVQRQEESDDGLADAVIAVGAQQGLTRIIVEIKRSLTPKGVEEVVSRARLVRRVAGHVPLLVISPWLSQRTRTLLTEAGVNYMDLSGSARISTDYPALFIQRESNERPPKTRQSIPSLRGSKAGRVARLLVDVQPPYGVLELARYAAVSPGYVSRLLDALEGDGLIQRERRGTVTMVDWREVLTRRAESYGVFTSNRIERFVCPNGPGFALEVAGDPPIDGSGLALTGSFAVERAISLAPAALLILYTRTDQSALIEIARLLPATSGANVIIARPGDGVIMEPRWPAQPIKPRVPVVAASQLALDCLTGVGRMPQEGEAFLNWMAEHETEWRLSSLAGVTMPQDVD